jgi:cardiolipin synthase
MRHLPNILSGIRLILIGVFVLQFRAGSYLPALCVFVVAFLTDILDGHIARSFGWVTDVGKLLDPLADKLMTLAALVCIYYGKQKPLYLILFLLMALKELLMVIGGVFMVKRKVVANAGWPGKIATGLIALGIMLSLMSFLSMKVEPWNLVVLVIATAMAYFALFYYAATQLPRAFGKRDSVETTVNQKSDG